MKSKIITAILCVVLVFASTIIGFNIGAYQQKKETVQEADQRSREKKEPGKLAIVNMDEGIKYDAEVVNYGTTLISSIPTEHVITGLEDARAGLLTGKYSAYIILPTTFSESVESINSQPQQAPIEYAVSSVIKSQEREDAIYNVQDVYHTLNNNLTQIYMATILEEFHDTQDAATTVLEQDKKDTSILADVSGYDLKDYIKLPELKMVENTIKPLDLQAQYDKNTQVLEEIDSSYQSSLTETQGAVDTIKGKNQTLTEKTGTLKGSLQAAKEEADQTVVTQYDDSQRAAEEDTLYRAKKEHIEQSGKEQKEKNENTIEEYTTKLDESNEEIKDIVEKYEYAEGKYREVVGMLDTGLSDTLVSQQYEDVYAGNGTPDEKKLFVLENKYQYYSVADMTSVVADANGKIREGINNNLSSYYSGQATARQGILRLLTQLDDPANSKLPSGYTSWAEYMAAVLPAPVTIEPGDVITAPQVKELTLRVPEQDILPPNNYMGEITGIESGDSAVEGVNDIINKAQEGRSARNSELTTQTEAFETKATAMKQKTQGADAAYQEAETQHLDLTNHIVEYDPLAYIKYNDLREYRTTLDKNSNETETIINTQNSDYERYVSDISKAASENTTAQSEAIQKGQEASDKKLDDGLSAAKSSRNKSNELNSTLLYDLTLKLPYTRIGGVENRTAYTVMANPVVIKDKSSVLADSEQVNKERAAAKERDMGQSMDTKEMVMVLVIVLAILLILAAILATKKKQLAEEF